MRHVRVNHSRVCFQLSRKRMSRMASREQDVPEETRMPPARAGRDVELEAVGHGGHAVHPSEEDALVPAAPRRTASRGARPGKDLG